MRACSAQTVGSKGRGVVASQPFLFARSLEREKERLGNMIRKVAVVGYSADDFDLH
jgi:hypothetical protein